MGLYGRMAGAEGGTGGREKGDSNVHVRVLRKDAGLCSGVKGVSYHMACACARGLVVHMSSIIRYARASCHDKDPGHMQPHSVQGAQEVRSKAQPAIGACTVLYLDVSEGPRRTVHSPKPV